jgi:hypothetical protein
MGATGRQQEQVRSNVYSLAVQQSCQSQSEYPRSLPQWSHLNTYAVGLPPGVEGGEIVGPIALADAAVLLDCPGNGQPATHPGHGETATPR